jgi:hypothetical protein
MPHARCTQPQREAEREEKAAANRRDREEIFEVRCAVLLLRLAGAGVERARRQQRRARSAPSRHLPPPDAPPVCARRRPTTHQQVGDEGMSLEALAEAIQVDPSDIVRSLFMKGIMLSLNQVCCV